MFTIGLTDHLEGPPNCPSAEIFNEVADIVRLADELGVRYAWFAEHHIHTHFGHLPTPLLFALHLAGQTKQIHLGTAIICLNLHNPLSVAEHVNVADILANHRLAPGFGSGSTPEEFKLFDLPETADEERHMRFENSLRAIRSIWRDDKTLPKPAADLHARSWLAVNSVGSAKIAGAQNFNMLFSHLRTPEQYRQYRAAYHAAGGTRKIAANRPVFVGKDDATAFEQCEPALRILWRRFRHEGKIPADTPEPTNPADLCVHPINFIIGGPQSVADQLQNLHKQVPFDVANIEVRWAGLSHDQVRESLSRFMQDTIPLIIATNPIPS